METVAIMVIETGQLFFPVVALPLFGFCEWFFFFFVASDGFVIYITR